MLAAAQPHLAEIGDLAVYRQQSSGHILHVGEVVMHRMIDAGHILPQRQRVPWILSKWGASGGETIHHYSNALEQLNGDLAIEFWTDRP